MSVPEPNFNKSAISGKAIDLGQAEILNTSQRGDGRQQIIKLPCDNRFIILKCYGLKRSRLRALIRQFGSFFLVKKSSFTAKGRRETELAVLALWKREGFDVPDTYEPPLLPENFPYCIVMEWLPGPSMTAFLRDKDVSLDIKKQVVKRYAKAWGERHARAIELTEPRLLQENPTLAHVFVSGDRLVHIDFEIVFTWKKDLARLVRREIVGILDSMAKSGGDIFPSLLETLLETYPDLSHFRLAAEELLRYGTVPEVGWSAPLHLLTRGKKRYRKRRYFIDTLNTALKNRSARVPRCEKPMDKK